jgi:hypothetical protein
MRTLSAPRPANNQAQNRVECRPRRSALGGGFNRSMQHTKDCVGGRNFKNAGPRSQTDQIGSSIDSASPVKSFGPASVMCSSLPAGCRIRRECRGLVRRKNTCYLRVRVHFSVHVPSCSTYRVKETPVIEELLKVGGAGRWLNDLRHNAPPTSTRCAADPILISRSPCRCLGRRVHPEHETGGT